MELLPKVFLCYARADNRRRSADDGWLDKVRQFLSPFEAQDEIRVFHDENVRVGDKWDPRILHEVETCDVAVLLVSAAFLDRPYIRNDEMPALLRRWHSKEVLLVPVLLSPCGHDHVWFTYRTGASASHGTRLADLQQSGGIMKPLKGLRPVERDRRLTEMARTVMDHVRSNSRGRAARPRLNSLEMGFVFVPGAGGGAGTWFSKWPTRWRDYKAFALCHPNIDLSWESPAAEGIPMTPGMDHPVVNVSWNEANAFCKWLTAKDAREGFLPPHHQYRLPTDLEWSAAVGLGNEAGVTPEKRDEQVPGIYPWGRDWPPPATAGNFADAVARGHLGRASDTIHGFRDGHPATSPVGSFETSSTGLQDLSGNVWEWCADRYNATQDLHVLRGGSWRSGHPSELLASSRNCARPDERADDVGFRIVVGRDQRS